MSSTKSAAMLEAVRDKRTVTMNFMVFSLVDPEDQKMRLARSMD